MKGANEIYMDFRRAGQAIEELEEVAEILHTVSNVQMRQMMEQLSISWKCPGADIFQRKEECLREKIVKTEQSIQLIADELRRDARRLKKKKKRAYEIASKRTS